MNSTKQSLGTLVQMFFQERLIRQQNASQNTIASYRDTWRLFLVFLTEQKGYSITSFSMNDLTAEMILAFLDHLETDRKCCIRSRNQRLAALKAFFHFAVYVDPTIMGQAQRVLGLPMKRYERKAVGYLTKPEMDSILAVPNRSTISGRRVYSLLLFMYNTGARVSEITALKVTDIRILKNTAQVLIHGKGNKQRIVPLWKETAEVLKDLIDEQNDTSSLQAPVFKNARGLPISRSGITHLLHITVEKSITVCSSLNGRTVSPHIFRHTTAMHLLQSGVDMQLIRMWLGHVNLDTTHQYIEADLDMKRKALEKGGIFPGTANQKWQPTDEILTFLNGLG